jgi:hypothetical protein
MPQDFPELQDGDQLEPWHLNVIYDELRRLRLLKGAGTLQVNQPRSGGPPVIEDVSIQPFYIQLTGAYSSGYPWKEVMIGPTRGVADAGVTGDSAHGDPAYELQSGDTTLTADGTVYQAWRSPASNEVLFDGKN